MKRVFLLTLAAILLASVLPYAKADATEQPHTIEADRVLIYNPLPYDANGNTLFSGTITVKPEDEEPSDDPEFRPGMHITGKDLSRDRKDPNTHDFWVCIDLVTYRYDKRTFRLAAEGEHCYIWVMEEDSLSFTEEQTAAMLEQFETVIYPSDTGHFGGFRDLSGDGKLHIVTYAMNSTSVCGFFDLYDLYTREEILVVDPDDPDSYNYLPIINVNARMASREDVVFGTLAHEFQHLILRSAVLESPANADRLGNEIMIGTWLNEGFSMAAEELAYPGSVAEQGYVEAYGRSEKVRLGMSCMHFDATGTDVGAYGQSFLFTEYLRSLCGDTVFHAVLDYWRETEDASALSEAAAIRSLLSAEQTGTAEAICAYSEAVENILGSSDAILLSKLALTFRIAILLQAETGLFCIGTSEPTMPAYDGTGRRIEGGGALLVECGGSFAVPADADSGLVFVGIRDGAVTEIYQVPEPEEGFYVIAAQYDGAWYAIPAAPSREGVIRPIAIDVNADGTIAIAKVYGAIFEATRTNDGFRFTCDDPNGFYTLSRAGSSKQGLKISADDGVFTWSHFADGSDRLQADGYYGRAILYGSYQNGFAYLAPGFFENSAFAKPKLLRVEPMRGDANNDGKLTAADAAIVLRTLVGLSYMNAPMRAAGDMDGDGEITAADAARILRIVIQLDN